MKRKQWRKQQNHRYFYSTSITLRAIPEGDWVKKEKDIAACTSEGSVVWRPQISAARETVALSVLRTSRVCMYSTRSLWFAAITAYAAQLSYILVSM